MKTSRSNSRGVVVRSVAILALLLLGACGDDDDDGDAMPKASGNEDAAGPDGGTHNGPKSIIDAGAASDAMTVTDSGEVGDDNDAGSDSDAGETSTNACETRDCLCEAFCSKVAKAACAKDPPRAQCVTKCMTPDKAACAEEDLAALRCRAMLPESAFGCAPFIDEHMITGCTTETDAFSECLVGS